MLLLLLFVFICGNSSALYAPLLLGSRSSAAKMCSECEPLADDVIGQPPGLLPTTSSRVNFGKRRDNIRHDLWIVGAGTLGSLIVKELRISSRKMRIIAETLQDDKQALTDLGAEHKLRQNRHATDDGTAKSVVICIPPSSSQNYTDEIHQAASLWAGPEAGGNLIYTSSIGIYGESLGNIVDEDFRVDTRSAPATRLLAAEEAVLSRGGNVIRLAGLYTASRGPHAYWLQRAREAAGGVGAAVNGAGEDVLNMLHYEDAARAVVSLLHKPEYRSQIFLACDNEPISKAEICRSAIASGLFPDCPMPQFALPPGPMGKICNSAKTRKLLDWQPQHTSFRVFMRRLGGEVLPDVPMPVHSDAGSIQAPTKESEGKSTGLWVPGMDGDEL